MNRLFLTVLGFALSSPVWAHDYPTVDRVEYVLECLSDHRGKQEYLYKCSCAIDAIAKELPYDDYVEASTASRYQSLGGEKGGVFRDPELTKSMAKKFRDVRARANQKCNVK